MKGNKIILIVTILFAILNFFLMVENDRSLEKINANKKVIEKEKKEKPKVEFRLYRNYNSKTYDIMWYLWIDGNISERGQEYNLPPEMIVNYKKEIRKREMKRVPELLKIWKD